MEAELTTRTLPGPEPRAEENYGKLASLAMLLFAVFGCLAGMGLGATLVFWLKP